MGIKPGFDPTDPTVDAAILEIVKEAKKAGIFAGIHCGFPPYIKRMWQEGYDFCSMMSDTRFLAMQAASLLEEFRADAGGPQSSTY
jgi:4-hydroxy-2-oxoheptanedioate aldolase